MNYALSWLLRRHAGRTIPCSELARQAGLSGADLTHDLAALERFGFRLEKDLSGIAAVETPQSYDRDEIAFARRGCALGHTVHVYDTTGSTNDVAARLATAGPAGDGIAVLAEQQTAGRGRQGGQWFSTRRESLLLSVLHWADPRPQRAAEITLATGAAVAEAVGRTAGVRAGIKWPNDVEIERCKVAGVLVERPRARAGTADVPGRVPFVIGLGVNVNQPRERFGGALSGRAASLLMACGRAVDRICLLDAILDALERALAQLEGAGPEALLDRYMAHSDMIGRRVRVLESGRTFSGTVRAISPHNALVLQLDAGGHRSFEAARVRLL